MRNFWTVFQKWLCHFTFPPVVYEGSNFSTSSLLSDVLIPAILASMMLYLIAVFPWWQMMSSIFSCDYLPLVYILCRNVYSDPLPILKFGYYLYIITCKTWYILDKSRLSDIWFVNIFSHSVGCLHLLDIVFRSTKLLILMQFNLFFLMLLVLLCHI